MTKRVEIFVAMVDRVGNPGFQAGAAAAVHDQFTTDSQGFSLVVQTAQTASAIASVLSVTQMTAGAVPFLNIVTNTLAGTVTFLKIVAESKEGKEPKEGDYISLVGNVAGVVAGFALLAAAPYTAGVFTAVALGASLLGTYNSELAKNIATAIAPIMNSLKTHDISSEAPKPILAPNLAITNPETINNHFGGLIQVVMCPAHRRFQMLIRNPQRSFATSSCSQHFSDSRLLPAMKKCQQGRAKGVEFTGQSYRHRGCENALLSLACSSSVMALSRMLMSLGANCLCIGYVSSFVQCLKGC